MTNSKTTRKALLSSVLALTMCVAMLVATTFAWFTDTASTAVNKIQAGTLEVDIVDADNTNTSIQGTGLKFKNANDSTDILWEPGVTFRTDGFKIKNTGNLALKYKLALTGIDGSAELLKVIEFSVVKEDGDGTFTNVNLDNFEGNLTATENLSETLYIQGHMDESAGNEYQTKTLEGIGITVVATQLDSEFDSSTDQYDANAEYPVYVVENVEVTTESKVKAEVKVKTTETIDIEDGTAPLAQATVPANVQLESGKTQVALSITDGATVADGTAVEDNQASKSFEIKLEGVASTNIEEITVEFYTEKNLSNVKIYHSGTAMKAEKYNYDSTTGKVTIRSATFSPFDLVYDKGVKEAASEAGLVAAIQNAKAGDTIKLTNDITIDPANYNSDNRLYVSTNNITIDLNTKTLTVPNYTLSLSGDNITLKNGNVVASQNGSYAIVANGKNVTIDGVTIGGLTTIGGISVSGYAGNNVKKGVSATIKNCNITAKAYYAVCAQGEASAIVESSTLDASNGTAIFWIEKAFTDEYGKVGDSNLTYDSKTVTLTQGDKPLYNTIGLAPVAK